MPANRDNRRVVTDLRIAKRPDEPPILEGTYEGTSYAYGNLNGTVIPLETPLAIPIKSSFTSNGRFVERSLLTIYSDMPIPSREPYIAVWEVHIDHYGRKHWELQMADTINDNGQWTINPTKTINKVVTEFDAVYVEKGYMPGNSLQTPLVSYWSAKKVDS